MISIKRLPAKAAFFVSLTESLFYQGCNYNHQNATYKLVFNLENCGSAVTSRADTTSIQHLKNCNAILFSADFIREFYIEKKIPVKRVVLLFSASWLERNFSQASDTIHQLIQDLKIKNRPTYISQLLDNKTFIMINELAKELTTFGFPLLQVKTRGLIILNNFLTKIVSHEPTIVNNETGITFAQIHLKMG